MAAKKKASTVLQLKIELEDSEPLIWRRFLVREDVLLIELHNTIQTVMGWWDSHLHRFEIEDKGYWNGGENEFEDDVQDLDVETSLLCDALKPSTKSFRYDYDFGDNWRHTVTIEKRLALEDVVGAIPQCLAGANACPPEDVGNFPGFDKFKKAMENPGTKAFLEHGQWYGSNFQAESFCSNLVNRELRHLMLFDWREKPKSRHGTMLNAAPYRR